MQFLNAFFFSAQTLTTVGYGAIAPTGIGPNIVASIEAFVGLWTFAMATGLLYGRFSKPRARILYSTNALVAPYEDGTGLMIRVANARRSQLINVHTRIMLSLIEGKNPKDKKREFYFLDLEMDSIRLLPSSWTIVHPINEDSPFKGLSHKDLHARDVEIMISLEAFDETYSQQVHSRTSYKPAEIVYNARFVKILGRNNHGQSTVELDKLSEYTLQN